jgi:hypothetical protein
MAQVNDQQVGSPGPDETKQSNLSDAIDDVVAYIERWGLLPHARAAKAIEFLTSPTWRAYISCYVEGLPLCRNWVGGDPVRFATLLTEQVVPDDLVSA